jgi:hypothetical protein
MLICIDSCVFIRGLDDEDSDAAEVLRQIGPALPLVIPRLIALEVTRNLATPTQIRTFYRQFTSQQFAFIVEEPAPRDLVLKYTQLGLPAKADAFIGAFAEWMQVNYLISDNRHFLQDLNTKAYAVVTPALFLDIWESKTT